MSRKRKLIDVDLASLENAKEKRRVLILRKAEDDVYYCSVVPCSHPGFSNNRGIRKHINNLHPWYYYFDEKPKLEIRETAAENDMTKKPCTLKMPSFPTNSELALKFSAWLTAICGGGTSQLQSQQTASRAMKFLKFLR